MPKKNLTPQKQLIQEKTAALIALTDHFSDLYLDAEYRGLCEKLIRKLSRKREVPFLRGKLEIWAAAVVHALGTINFLFDRSFEPAVSASEIAKHFGAAMSTVSSKSKLIQGMFKLHPYHEEFTLPSLADQNPLNNYVMVNGMITPVSALPPYMQEVLAQNPHQSIEFEVASLDELELDDDILEQIERVTHILDLQAGESLDVSLPLLKRYREYLQTNLPWPFKVIKSPEDHDGKPKGRSKKEMFEVVGLSEHIDMQHALQYRARRKSDGQLIDLPIHQTAGADCPSKVELLIEDYLSWIYNCGFDDE